MSSVAQVGSNIDDPSLKGGMMEEEASSSFLYIDDDGTVIPPEEETSWLMALGLRGHGDTPAPPTARHSPNSSNNDASLLAASSEQQMPYTEDPTAFERERQLAGERLDAAMEAATTGVDSDSTDGEEEECSGEESADYMASREATLTEEEWVLEQILDRRVTRNVGTSSDYKVYYDDFGNKETAMSDGATVEYLCRWKWYIEPTWEKREVMEDEGFGPDCKVFDESAKSSKSLKVAPLWTDVHPEEAVKIKKKKKEVCGQRHLKEVHFGDLTLLSKLCGLSIDLEAAKFKREHLTLFGYGSCATDEQIHSFLQLYQQKRKTHRPVILYHGTQIQNISSICTNGFRVPKRKLDVTNGSAHGMGIYAAPFPATSMGFCRRGYHSARMLLCVALVSPTDGNVKTVGDYCVVFYQRELILPVLALDVFPQQVQLYCLPQRKIHSIESLGHSSPFVDPNSKPKPGWDFDDGVPKKEKATTLRKITKKNIFNINRLAESAKTAKGELIP